MSKKLVATAVSIFDALARDIAGNIFFGNNERALVYLKGQMEVIAALQKNMETNNDVRADNAFEAAIMDINSRMYEKLDNQYPIDMTRAGETMATFKKSGFEMQSFLKPVSEVMSGLSPELEEYIKKNMSTTVI